MLRRLFMWSKQRSPEQRLLVRQIHAEKTERFLIGKRLDDAEEFQAALKVLDEELNPEEDLQGPGSDYLKTVAQGLFYKVFIKLVYLLINRYYKL